jgi:hypothetical protein
MSRVIAFFVAMLSLVSVASPGVARDLQFRYDARLDEQPQTLADQAVVRRSLESLRKQVVDRAAHYQAADAETKPRKLSELVATARARQQRLLATIETHPGAVIDSAVSAELRASLPASVQAYLEERVTLDGEMEVLYADEAQGGGRLIHGLRTGGRRLGVHFAEAAPELLTGDRVRVQGVRVAQELALGGSEQGVTLLAAGPLAGTTGVQRTAVIILSFQDKPTVTSVSNAEAADVLFKSPTSVNKFYQEASYGQTSVTGDVFGPYVVPFTSGTCNYSGMASAGENAAATAGVSLANYNRLVFAFPQTSCGWWGLAGVGGLTSRAWINGTFVNGVVAHEMGHNLGMSHSHAMECGDLAFGGSCSSVEYGDTMDTMGSAWPPKHFNAAQKERLGWLNSAGAPPITTVTTSGVYTIDPYHLPGPAPKALKIAAGSGGNYYIEFRQAAGFDAAAIGNNANLRNGVLVHWMAENQGNQIFLLDMTEQTSDWADPALALKDVFSDSNVTITPVWVGANAGVNVTFGAGGACVRKNPTLVVSPAAQTGAPDTAVTYKLTITNNDAGCGASDFNQSATVPTGWTASIGGTSIRLNPGASTATTVTVRPPSDAWGGTYSIQVSSANAAGGSAATATPTYTIPESGSVNNGSFTDYFNRPDGAVLGSGWTKTGGDLTIVGGRLETGPKQLLHAATVAGLTGASQQVEATFVANNATGGPRFGFFLRRADARNYYACYQQVGGTRVVGISKVQNGVETVLQTIKVTNPKNGTPFTVSCSAQGSTLTVTAAGKTVSVTDTTFTTGGVGLFMGYTKETTRRAAVHHADDFKAIVQ